ncbi:hydroxylamine reductase, partial [bacterium]|nr:hydroxylamine reductase [bacterium]
MFCYQCEQTAKGEGCTSIGVCGKDNESAVLQDLIIHGLKGIAMYAYRARQLGAKDHEIDVFTLEALFATVTNVNFDPESLKRTLLKLGSLKTKAKTSYITACSKAGKAMENLVGPAAWISAGDLDGLIKQGQEVSIAKRKEKLGDDITGLQELLTYGLKGMAAYAHHAQILGKQDDKVYAFIHEALNF